MRSSDDPHRVTLAMSVATLLACCKHSEILPVQVRWQLNAYTNWNLALIALRVAMSIPEWDPFLCVNSIGILVGFRTAFAQGLDDNIRKKLNAMGGLRLSRRAFKIADFVVHTLPACALTALLIRQRRRIPFVATTYAMTLSSWFVFRQAGCLDASAVYVPHPWKRGWLAIVVSVALAPTMVHSAQARHKWRTLLCLLGMWIPYALTRLDPHLKRTYDFEKLLDDAAASRARSSTDALRRATSTGSLDARCR